MQKPVKIVADSITPSGHRLTTLEATVHRFVLAELNTHRVLSRNSASSRAIPVEKRIAMVRECPAYPYEWGKNQPGMQADEFLPPDEQRMCEAIWKNAANRMADYVETLVTIGLHKQVANRLLEPFVMTTVLITATEWDNFIRQRCSRLAAPEMRVPAIVIAEELAASTPIVIHDGEWHLPYISTGERQALPIDVQRRISVARCARVSTLTQDGIRSIEADLKLFDRLVTAEPPHWSPLEHVATPCAGAPGNLTGWLQFRHAVDYAKSLFHIPGEYEQ